MKASLMVWTAGDTATQAQEYNPDGWIHPDIKPPKPGWYPTIYYYDNKYSPKEYIQFKRYWDGKNWKLDESREKPCIFGTSDYDRWRFPD